MPTDSSAPVHTADVDRRADGGAPGFARLNRRDAAVLAGWLGCTMLACWPDAFGGAVWFGWPAAFWWGAQGAIVAYVLLTVATCQGPSDDP